VSNISGEKKRLKISPAVVALAASRESCWPEKKPKIYTFLSRMFIPEPGSEFFPSQIPDPHQRIQVF
jgi:hypothetical protein